MSIDYVFSGTPPASCPGQPVLGLDKINNTLYASGQSGWVNLSASTVLTGNTAAVQAPSPLATSECPGVVNPFMFMQDTVGTYHTAAGIDPSNTGSNPPSPYGVFTWCRKFIFNDTLSAPPSGKNAMVVINHRAGTATNVANQDRALWISMDNAASDVSTHYGIAGLQVEVDLNGTPSINGSPDGEVSAGSFQLADNHTGTIARPVGYGVNGVRTQVYREAGTGTYSAADVGWSGIFALADNLSTVSGGSVTMAAGTFRANDQTGAASLISGVGVRILKYINRLTRNWGLLIDDFGSNVTNSADYNIVSSSSGADRGLNVFEGDTVVRRAIRVAQPNGASHDYPDPGNTDFIGNLTLSSGTQTYTFVSTYNVTRPPRCFCNNRNTTPTACTALATNTTLTVKSGAASDVVDYLCVGRD